MFYWILAVSGFIIIVIFLFYLQKKATYFITHPWKAEVFNCNYKFIKDFQKKHNFFSSTPLIGKVSISKKDIQLTENLLLEIHKKIKDPKKRVLAVSEILTKVLAYRDLKKGDEIHIPVIDQKGKNKIILFIVDNVFDIWKEMPAFGLIPKNLNLKISPILLFRGTDFSLTTKRGLASIISDLDFLGPGYSAYFKVRASLRNWLKKAYSISKTKARAMGFSLGGAFSTYSVIFEHDLLSDSIIQPSISFNPPGVQKKILKIWENLPTEDKPPYLVFIAKNDLVSSYGNQIGQIYKFSAQKIIPPIHAHVSLMIAEDKYHLVPIEL